MSEAHAILMGPINAELAERALSFLREKVSNDCIRIHLAIQSPGGSVPVALSLANILQSLPCQITTYNIGNVDSAAVILFAAGTERICAREAIFCLHPISKEVTGLQTIDTLSSLVREIEEDTARVTRFLSRRTEKTTPSRWRELMSEPHVISADTAVEIGLANRIDECRFALGSGFSTKDFPDVLVEPCQSTPKVDPLCSPD
jgi:ATP-dependent protease ClpP protease subunit